MWPTLFFLLDLDNQISGVNEGQVEYVKKSLLQIGLDYDHGFGSRTKLTVDRKRIEYVIKSRREKNFSRHILALEL